MKVSTVLLLFLLINSRGLGRFYLFVIEISVSNILICIRIRIISLITTDASYILVYFLV